MRFQPQPLSLQRQRPAAGKGIVEGRKLVPVEEFLRPGVVGVVGAGPTPALPDLVAGLLQHRLVGGVLPFHELLDDPEKPLALLLLRLLSREEVRPARRIVHHLGEDNRPRGSQRPSRPPQMKRARMPVPDGLLPRRRLVNRLQRQGDLDEFFPDYSHSGNLPSVL